MYFVVTLSVVGILYQEHVVKLTLSHKKWKIERVCYFGRTEYCLSPSHYLLMFQENLCSGIIFEKWVNFILSVILLKKLL